MREYSLGESKVSRFFHVCGFFNSRDEQYDVLMPFFSEAINQKEKLVNIVDPKLRADHLKRLTAGGVDTHQCEACGALEVLGWDQAYLAGGQFDMARMLVMIDETCRLGREAGYPRMRITGEMGWALVDGTPGSEQLIEYEARVNNVLTKNQQPAICIYDTAQLTGSMMMDILRTHPLTLVGGVVQENPFFIDPEKFLDEIASRRARNVAN